jgi:polar amino acid transport system substrate-binding protein
MVTICLYLEHAVKKPGQTIQKPHSATLINLARRGVTVGLLGVSALLAGCATTTTGTLPAPTPAQIAELAPTGKLRAAINFGNPILATRDAASGAAKGVSVDISTELARRLGVPLELVTFNAAGRVVEGLKSGAVDVVFVAIDPERAMDIAYSNAYVVIEGAYLVRQGSPVRANADVDRAGTRVVVGKGSAYDLYLSRELKQATLVRAATSPEVTDFFLAQNLEVAAGVKQQLEADSKRIPGLRLLDGRFMVINQAMGTPRARNAGVAFLTGFVEDLKRSGFVAQALKRHGIEGASVAAAGR